MERLLDNTYRIEKLLGRGGMGAVYKAHDVRLDRDVAIKVMHPHFADDPGFRDRFLQEARAIAALRHAGVVLVHAFGQEADRLYIVMEFIPGQTLQAWLKKLTRERKLIFLTESLVITQQVALALHYAHGRGVLHRDVKPANIMLKPTDPALREPGDLPFQPVLTDFGLAKLAEGTVQTETGTTMGTVRYMSPEQCLHLEMDHRSDIYSLGVVLFELATGRVPFEFGSLTEAVRRHIQEEPPPAPRSINPSLPYEVEEAILCALERRPEDRFASAREMAEAIRAAIPRVPADSTVAATAVEGSTSYDSLMTRLAEESLAPAPPTRVREAVPPPAPPDPSLVVFPPEGESRRIPVGERRALTVGRTGENDLELADGKVSRRHACIEFDGQRFSVTDLNSTNGSFLGASRLLPGVSQPWPPGVFLRIGDHWLKCEGQAVPGTSAVGAPSFVPSERPSAVVLEPQDLTVEAGRRVAAQLRILNQGAQVDHFSVGVDGIPPSWVTFPKEPMRLTPNEEGVVALTFHPPREPGSAAGPHAFTVRVISQNDPEQIARADGMLTIDPFHELVFEMSPTQITGRARLELTNQGNALADLTITGTDPAEALRIQVTPSQLTLQPGEGQTVPLEAAPKKGRPWLGRTQRHPFEVTVAPSAGQAIKQGGTLVVKTRFPVWVSPLVSITLIALCLLLFYFVTRPPVIHSLTVDPPNPEAGQPVTVRWRIDNARSVAIRPLYSGLDPSQGEYTIDPGFERSTTLTVVASNWLRSVEQSLSIDVTATTLALKIRSFTVEPIELVQGQQETVLLTWDTEGADTVTIEPDLGSVGLAGSRDVSAPSKDTTYTLVAQNAAYETRAHTTVKVTQDITLPEVKVTHTPPQPTTMDEITFQATAADNVRLDRIEITVNEQLVETCSVSPCTYVGGPYATGDVSYEAYAYDGAGNQAGTGQFDLPLALTISQVWQRATSLGGQVIRVRGWANLSTATTLMLCVPPRCDCNRTWGQFGIQSEQGAPPRGIAIPSLECRGDECSMNCSPFDPEAAPAFEFVGVLKAETQGGNVSSLSLEDIDFEASSQLSGGTDLSWMTRSPIPTGQFTITLRDPDIPVDTPTPIPDIDPTTCLELDGICYASTTGTRDGDGTSVDPWLVTNSEELAALCDAVSDALPYDGHATFTLYWFLCEDGDCVYFEYAVSEHGCSPTGPARQGLPPSIGTISPIVV